MIELTPAELHALENLALKRGGDSVPFVNIADARRLTDLGLAARSREGWDITAEGSAWLARAAGGPHEAGE
jgi:hypothetical protein